MQRLEFYAAVDPPSSPYTELRIAFYENGVVCDPVTLMNTRAHYAGIHGAGNYIDLVFDFSQPNKFELFCNLISSRADFSRHPLPL